jgi:Flp pilus assembly protein TadG
MELVLTLPILGIVLLGLLEFTILFFARSTVVEACRAGARLATLPFTSVEAVEAQVLQLLGPRLQQGVQVTVQPGLRSGDVVTVAVRVPMSMAAPDLLWPIGYSLQGQDVYAELSMVKE